MKIGLLNPWVNATENQAVGVESGTAGFGVLARREEDFIYRMFVPYQAGRVIVNLSVIQPSHVGRIVVQAPGGTDPVRDLVEEVQVFVAGPRPPG